MWRSALGDFLVAEVPMILELSLVEVFDDALLFLGGLFHALIEFILRGMLRFPALELDRFVMLWSVNRAPAPRVQ